MNTLDTDASESLFDDVDQGEIIESTDDPFGESNSELFSEDTDSLDLEESTEDLIEPETEKQVKPTPTPEKKQPGRPSKVNEELQTKVESGKKILEYLAKRKGIDEQIDFDAIKDEDDIADVVEILEEFDKHHAINSIKASDKNIGKIIDFLEAGGDKNKLSEILIEQKEILDIDITTESGAKNILKQYYKNVLGLDDSVIQKRINKFSENGMLLEEAEDIKPLYDSDIDKRQEKIIQEAKKEKEKEALVINQRKKQFIDLLQNNKVSKPLAQKYYSTAFGERQLEDGTKISEMDYLYRIRQRDPNQYLKLVEFMSDPDSYDKKILQSKSNTIAVEQHNKRINFSNNKSPDVVENSGDKQSKLKFKF